jgi:hypothetical protein
MGVLRRRRINLLIAVFILAVVMVFAGYFYIYRQRNLIPENIRISVKGPIHYPSETPNGFTLDRNSFKSERSIVFYNLKSDDGQIVSISQQPLPSDFNFKSFAEKDLQGAIFNTKHGQAVVGESGQMKVGALLSGTSLVVVNGTSADLTEQELRTLIRALEKI